MRQIFAGKLFITALLCSALSLSGCDSGRDASGPVPEVTYLEVTPQPLVLTRELPGRVSAFMVSEVRPQVSGIIRERLFEEGADVEAGQVLYQIDPELFTAAYNSAKAALAREEALLASARLLAQRYGRIVASSAVSRQEHDDAVAAHEQAKANVAAAREALETARINLGYTRITAPVSGRVGRSFVTPGALVTQNQAAPLATLQQLSPVYVDVTQSSSELLRLRRALEAGELQSGGENAAKVRLLLEDGTPYARNLLRAGEAAAPDWIEGALLFSDVTVDQSTGVVTLRATFDNPGTVLLPGMYVRALVEEGVRERAVLVPQRCVLRDTRGRPYAYVLTKTPLAHVPDARTPGPDDYYVERREVTLDRNVGNRWLLGSGLQGGELVMFEGHQKARPGQVVTGAPVPDATADGAFDPEER